MARDFIVCSLSVDGIHHDDKSELSGELAWSMPGEGAHCLPLFLYCRLNVSSSAGVISRRAALWGFRFFFSLIELRSLLADPGESPVPSRLFSRDKDCAT